MPTKPLLLIAKSFHADALHYIHKELAQYFNIVVPESYTLVGLTSHIRKADVILGHYISDDLLRNAENLRYFQCVSSGLDHLNLDLFRQLHIEIGNSTSHAPHVAKFAIAMMLNIVCKISLNDSQLRQLSQNLSNSTHYSPSPSPRFFGECVGLIGYGAINKCIAQLLKPFDSQFHYYRKRMDPVSSSLQQIFSECKYIFVALPLTNETQNLVNEDLLIDNQMSPYIVNVGRAEVINRNALIKALKLNTISGYASDVAYGKDTSSPLGFNGLYDFPNVILSPHRAASTLGVPSYLPGAVANLVQVGKRPIQS